MRRRWSCGPAAERGGRSWHCSFAVFPANVNQLVNEVEIPGVPTPPRAALWARLPLQGLMIWAVLAGTRPVARPEAATDGR